MKIIEYSSPNYFVSNSPIKAVCLHGTAGPLHASLVELTNPKPDNPGAAVSSNYLIDYDGTVYKLVDFHLGHRAWANGIIENSDTSIDWLNEAICNKINPNLLTVSIEHVASERAMEDRKSMTDAQFNVSIELTAHILKYCGLRANHQTIIGHNQISGTRKYNCPGVIFPPAYTEVLILRHPELGP